MCTYSKALRIVAMTLSLAAAPFGALGQVAADLVSVSVSSRGADTPTCGAPETPCLTLGRAHARVIAGGTISIKDPGDYGSVQISKSVSIVNDGAGTATVSSASGDAIRISGIADVHLRGLSIDGIAGGANGITYEAWGNLTISNCIIRNFSVNGVNIKAMPGFNVFYSYTRFSVIDSLILGNGEDGILVFLSGANRIEGTISKTVLSKNRNGFRLQGQQPAPTAVANASVTIVDSIASNNASDGFGVYGYGGVRPEIQLRNSIAHGNQRSGVYATNDDPMATGREDVVLRISRLVVTGGIQGIYLGGDHVGLETFGDNRVFSNETNVPNNFDNIRVSRQLK